MTYERLTYQIKPFEILYQVTDHFGKWPTSWKLLSSFNSIEERANAYCDLESTSFRRYRLHTNEHELSALKAAEDRGRSAKLEMPGISPASDMIMMREVL